MIWSGWQRRSGWRGCPAGGTQEGCWLRMGHGHGAAHARPSPSPSLRVLPAAPQRALRPASAPFWHLVQMRSFSPRHSCGRRGRGGEGRPADGEAAPPRAAPRMPASQTAPVLPPSLHHAYHLSACRRISVTAPSSTCRTPRSISALAENQPRRSELHSGARALAVLTSRRVYGAAQPVCRSSGSASSSPGDVSRW